MVGALVGITVALTVVLGWSLLPDDPSYTPKHRVRPPVRDALERAVADSRRSLRQDIAPWAHASRQRPESPGTWLPPSDENVTKPPRR